MKKILITATIASMIFSSFSAFAEDGEKARLSGIYAAYNDIRVISSVKNAESISWYISKTENGDYAKIDGADGESYRVKSNDSEQWIKAAVTGTDGEVAETAPRKIEKRWTTRFGQMTIDAVTAEAPSKYVFNVDGTDLILLDTTESDSAKFLLMTKDSVGERVFSETGSQSVVGMAAFLNNLDKVEFYYNHTDTPNENEENCSETGYKGNKSYIQLPQSVLDAIDNNVVWKTEPMKTGQARERGYRGGIALPSVTDIQKYHDHIGWREGSEKGFWLRTPSNVERSEVLYANSAILGGIQSQKSDADKFGLKLMFYVDKDFFIDNKPVSAGSVVYDEIWKQYSKSELLKIYTQEELTALGYIDFAINTFEITGSSDGEIAHITINSRLGEKKDVTVLVAAYDADGMLSGINIDTVSCNDGNTDAYISLGDGEWQSAAAVIIDSAQNPAPIYKAVRITK